MDKKCKDWIDYWSEDDFWRDSQLWEINSKLFFKRVSQIIKFKKSDSVLDIGCGPGYVEALLAPLVKRVCAVDVAKQFIDICAKRCSSFNNVKLGLLRKDDYTNLEELGGSFSVILCVSVVQHYRNFKEIEALISSVRKIASSGALMLIADLPLERGMLGFIWDAFCSFLLSVRGGYSQILLCTAYYRWFRLTRYKTFCKETGQLYFTSSKIKSLISKLNLNARVIRGGFSVYANRLSLLIQF